MEGPGGRGHDLLGTLELVGAYDQGLAADDELLSGPERRAPQATAGSDVKILVGGETQPASTCRRIFLTDCPWSAL